MYRPEEKVLCVISKDLPLQGITKISWSRFIPRYPKVRASKVQTVNLEGQYFFRISLGYTQMLIMRAEE